MSSRVIRRGLLSSEPVSGLHDRTFRLYVGLILSADDYGLVEIGFGPIKESHALLEWSREIVAKMLGELTDVRLILPYEVGRKRYAAIDLWESMIYSKRPQHPIPSFGLTHIRKVYGFKDAQTRIAAALYLSHLGIYSGVTVPPPAGKQSTTVPPLVTEERREKREEKRKSADLFGSATWDCPDDVDLAAWADWLTVRKKKKAATSERAYSEVLAKLEAIRHAGLNPSAFVAKSANSGWTDIYPPEGNGKAKSAPQQNMSDFGAWDTSGANINLPPPKG